MAPRVPRPRRAHGGDYLHDQADKNGDKLDTLNATMTEVRIGVANLSGDVRAALGRLDGHDTTRVDFERRLRVLEARSYAIPGIATLVGLTSTALAAWVAFHR